MSSLGRHIEYVPLETDTASLLSRIANLAITDSFIFASDGTRLIKFSIDGSFIGKVGSEGRGPGQYTNLSSLQADNEKQELYVLAMRQVLVFGFDCKLKRTFNIDFPVRQFLLEGEDKIVFHPINLPVPPDNTYSLYISDRSGNILENIVNDLARVNKGMVIQSSPMYIYEGSLHFMEFGTDTMFIYKSSTREPYAVFHLGDLKLPPDPTIEEAPSAKGIWINDSKETDEFLLFSYWEGLSGGGKKCIYEKRTSAITVLKENDFINDLDGGLNFWPNRILPDKTLVDFEEAITFINHLKDQSAKGTLIDEKLKELLNKIDENSNPVLVFLR